MPYPRIIIIDAPYEQIADTIHHVTSGYDLSQSGHIPIMRAKVRSLGKRLDDLPQMTTKRVGKARVGHQDPIEGLIGLREQ
jgi:hypothetical protein